MQCKYYHILIGRTCEWSLWSDGRFIEVVFKTGSNVHIICDYQTTTRAYSRNLGQRSKLARKGTFL